MTVVKKKPRNHASKQAVKNSASKQPARSSASAQKAKDSARMPAKPTQAELQGLLTAMTRSLAVIEFSLDGMVLTANEGFLTTLGYALDEIVGKHHSMFVDPAESASAEYHEFWAKLGRGEYDAGQYKRIGKGGRVIWIQASYNPVVDQKGCPFKVVKLATDITAEKLKAADFEGQLQAVSKAQAVIEFTLGGNILAANDNFLQALGYTLEEVIGKPHSLFVEPAERDGAEYRAFWEKLGRGEFDAGQYKRIGKSGREVWIQASYNPIMDAVGKPFKVVKYATDITAQKLKAADFEGQLQAVSKAQAVIEFTLDGYIVTANDNFLNALGYSLDELKGKHHSMLVEPAERDGPAYRALWDKLGRGEFDNGQYKRIGKNGKEVWIQASYNPIMDMNGRPFKVVKYATNVTELVLFTERMKTTVQETADIAADAISGNLTRRIERRGDGELGELSDGINSLLDGIAGLVARVQAAATEVTRGASEISQGNLDLSQRTEQQASSLEQTASSMEQMTSTVKQNADNAKQASQLATAARDQADKGGSVVSNAIRAMTEINESSKKIVDIIGVIDEIAFQTNLLALNAAVEAARAGEQGRGFAVVASEVRNLASRSATAAKEIKGLIQDSVEKVEEGSALVTQSGQTLEQIVGSVKKVSDIIGEIAAASLEQSIGIEQVNKAVVQLDEVTQQNAALVEEATAASQSLADQSTNLSSIMEHYQVSAEVAAGARSSMSAIGRGSPRATEKRPSGAPAAAAQGERRNAGRPWSGTDKPSVKAPPRAPSSSAAATGSDSEWKEF